jgi:hypothetical protein
MSSIFYYDSVGRTQARAGVGDEWLAPHEDLRAQRDLLLTGVARRLHAEGEPLEE